MSWRYFTRREVIRLCDNLIDMLVCDEADQRRPAGTAAIPNRISRGEHDRFDRPRAWTASGPACCIHGTSPQHGCEVCTAWSDGGSIRVAACFKREQHAHSARTGRPDCIRPKHGPSDVGAFGEEGICPESSSSNRFESQVGEADAERET